MRVCFSSKEEMRLVTGGYEGIQVGQNIMHVCDRVQSPYLYRFA